MLVHSSITSGTVSFVRTGNSLTVDSPYHSAYCSAAALLSQAAIASPLDMTICITDGTDDCVLEAFCEDVWEFIGITSS